MRVKLSNYNQEPRVSSDEGCFAGFNGLGSDFTGSYQWNAKAFPDQVDDAPSAATSLFEGEFNRRYPTRSLRKQPLRRPLSTRGPLSSNLQQQPQVASSSQDTNVASRLTRSGFKLNPKQSPCTPLRGQLSSVYSASGPANATFQERSTTPSLDSSGPSLSPEISHSTNTKCPIPKGNLGHSREFFGASSTSPSTNQGGPPITFQQKAQPPTKVERLLDGFVVIGSNWYATTSSPVVTVADLKSLLCSIGSQIPDSLSIEHKQIIQQETIRQESNDQSLASSSIQKSPTPILTLDSGPNPGPDISPTSPSTPPAETAAKNPSPRKSPELLETGRRSSGRQIRLSAKQQEMQDLQRLTPLRKRGASAATKLNSESTVSEIETSNQGVDGNKSGIRICLKKPEISIKLRLAKPASPPEKVNSNSEPADLHEASLLGPRKRRRPARYEVDL